MKKIICMLLLIQGGFIMAQTETLVTPNGKKVKINPNTINTAENGLSSYMGKIKLGGELTEPTDIGASATNTLSITGLQSANGFKFNTESILVTDIDGKLRVAGFGSLIGVTGGENVSVLGEGTVKNPFVISSPIQTALLTPSTPIEAIDGTTIAVPSDNVQGAIGDLAKDLSQKWNIAGNKGTNPDKNFIGTIDNVDLVFRRGNAISGRIGEDNVSFGVFALPNNTGTNNIAIGDFTLSSNNNGYSNTGVGSQALSSNKTGNSNAAIGASALYNNISGNENTAIGEGALHYLESGNNNIAIGARAGNDFFSGKTEIRKMSNSILIGNNTQTLEDNDSNEIVIGNNAIGRGSNTVTIGNNLITSIGGFVAWSNYSDFRLKKDINTSTYGLNFINKLRPVTYHMKTGTTDLQSGFIAQEVEAAANTIGYKFSGVVKPQNDQDYYSLRYSEFVVPLVKAVQEQQSQIETLQKELNDLKAVVQKLIDKK
ncbi:tail fiber domain-containing protein [Flavobacterium sp. 3-210]